MSKTSSDQAEELRQLKSELVDLRMTAEEHKLMRSKVAGLEAEKTSMSIRIAELEDGMDDERRVQRRIQTEREASDANAVTLQRQMALHVTAARSLETEVDRMKRTIAQMEKTARDTEARLKETICARDDLEAELGDALAKIEELSANNCRVQDDNKRVVGMMGNKETTIRSLRTQLTQTKEELFRASQIVAQAEDAQATNEDQHGFLRGLRGTPGRGMAGRRPEEPSVKELQAEIEELEARLRDSDKLYRTTREKLETALTNEKHASLTLAGDNERHMKVIMGLRTELNTLRSGRDAQLAKSTAEQTDEVKTLREERDAAKGALETAETRVADLRDTVRRLEGEAKAAKQTRDAAVLQAESDVRYIRKARATALEEASRETDGLRRELDQALDRIRTVEEQLRREVQSFTQQMGLVEAERDDYAGQLKAKARSAEVGRVEQVQQGNALSGARAALLALRNSQASIESELTDLVSVELFQEPHCIIPCGHCVSGALQDATCPECGGAAEGSVPNIILDNVAALFVFQRQIIAGLETALRT